MHSYNCFASKKEQQTIEKSHIRSARIAKNQREAPITMASIYEKMIHCMWDTKTVFPITYKLQSNDFSKRSIFKDDGQFGTKFLLNKMIADKVNLGYIQSFGEFSNVLQGAYLTGWKQVCHKHFPEPVNPSICAHELSICNRLVFDLQIEGTEAM